MAGNSFGSIFRITTFGESHGEALGVVIDGCPAGLAIDVSMLEAELRRRRPGQSRVTSTRTEHDRPEILSGLFEGRTTGAPLAVLFRNDDARARDYEDLREVYRPGHADYPTAAKYGVRDHRGGGRASARETIARVAGGAIAKQLLATEGIEIVGYTKSIGEIDAEIDAQRVTRESAEANAVRCPDPAAAAEMEAAILSARADGDSLGGIAELVARGCPPGLGEPVFDKLKADLAKALLSVPAVVGFECGSGFAAARMRGSAHNDAFTARAGEKGARIGTASNRHGGILGGLSSGEPIVVRVAVKPTSSIPREQKTVDTRGRETTVRVRGRHDPCLVPRFVPIGEAMVALVLADHVLRARTARIRGGEDAR